MIKFCLGFLALCGCVHTSTIIPFQGTGTIKATPTDPQGVAIYRVTKPTWKFSELGIITFKMASVQLPYIYQKLRTDAAAQGADAVLDLKISGEVHQETQMVRHCVPETVCDANGMCQTHDRCTDDWEWVTVESHLVAGSLVRRIQ